MDLPGAAQVNVEHNDAQLKENLRALEAQITSTGPAGSPDQSAPGAALQGELAQRMEAFEARMGLC